MAELTEKERWIGLKKALLTAPDRQLDASMFPLIEAFDTPPTALQLLEVIDKIIFSSLASGFVLTLLQLSYDDILEAEGKTHEDMVPLATWRDNV